MQTMGRIEAESDGSKEASADHLADLAVDAHAHVVESPLSLAQTNKLPVRTLLAMSSHPDEWQIVADAADRFAGSLIPAFGVHPWFSSRSLPPHTEWAQQQNNQTDPEWISLLKRFLSNYPQSIVGEIGLDSVAIDRCLSQPSHPPPPKPKPDPENPPKLYPMDQQLSVFLAQMRVAIDLQRPVSIHAVHVHGKLLDYFVEMDKLCGQIVARSKKSLISTFESTDSDSDENDSFDQKPTAQNSQPTPLLPCPPTIMMHSYTGSPELAKSLIRLPHIGARFFFSFSDKVNGPTTKKFAPRVVAVPDSRLLIESDTHDVVEVGPFVQRIAERVAAVKGWSVSHTIQQTARNAELFLKLFR